MAITVVCDNCGRAYAADETLAGRRVRCRGCGEIVQIPAAEGSAEDAPDLSALAAMEQTFADGGVPDATSVPSTADPSQPPSTLPAGMEDVPLSGAGIEAAGRANFRFNFLGARILDEVLPWGLVVGSLAFFSIQTWRNDDTGKPWITATRIILPLLLYVVFIWPMSFFMLKRAGRMIGFQLPRTGRWRAFASYFPAFTFTAAIWMMGFGSLISFVMGLLAGLLVASCCVWILFRLTPEEAPATTALGAAGFAIGAVISAGLLAGMNTVAREVVASTESVAAVPGSPLGSGFDWIKPPPTAPIPTPPPRRPPADPNSANGGLDAPPVTPPQDITASGAGPLDSPEIDVPANPGAAVVTGDNETPVLTPTPEIATPAPDVPTLPPVVQAPTSPLVSSFVPAPIEDRAEEFVVPMTPSPYIATHRREGDLMTVTLWHSGPWQQKGQARFNLAGGLGDAYAISPQGDWLARLVTFPRMAMQVWSLPENKMVRLIELEGGMGTPQLVGFLTPDRAVIRWDGTADGMTVLDVIDVRVGKSVRDRPLRLPTSVGVGNVFAFSPTGRFIAIAAKVDNEPTLLFYAAEGERPMQSIRIRPLGARWPVDPTGMAFSPDADTPKDNVVGLMFEYGGNALVLAYRQDGGTLGEPRVYPAGPPVPRPAFYAGSSLQWLASGKKRWWLIYGQAVVDPQSGDTLATIDVSGIDRCYPVDNSALLYVTGGFSGQRVPVRAGLDLSSLTTP